MKIQHTSFQPSSEGLTAYLQGVKATAGAVGALALPEAAAYFGVSQSEIREALTKLQTPARSFVISPLGTRTTGRGLSQEEALARLNKAIGRPVELTGLFGEKVSGTLVQLGGGVVRLERPGHPTGMPEPWPIDSIRAVRIGEDRRVAVGIDRRSEDARNPSGGLYGSPHDHNQRVAMAANFVGRANSGDPGSIEVARSLLMRVLEEGSVSPVAMTTFTFRTLRDRLGPTAQPMLSNLEAAYETVEAMRRIADIAGTTHQPEVVIELARLHFLAEAGEIIANGLGQVGRENRWAETEQGRQCLRALNEHLAAFGAGAVRSYVEWRAERDAAISRRPPEWSPCCSGEAVGA